MNTTAFPDFEQLKQTIATDELANLKPVGIYYNEYMTAFGMKMSNDEYMICGAKGTN
jgi:hypothetical protein